MFYGKMYKVKFFIKKCLQNQCRHQSMATTKAQELKMILIQGRGSDMKRFYHPKLQ